MSDLRTAAQQALEALKGYRREMAWQELHAAIKAVEGEDS